MNKKRVDGVIAAILGACLVIFSVGLTMYNIMSDRSAGKEAEEIVEALLQDIPLHTEAPEISNVSVYDDPAAWGAMDYGDSDVPFYVINPEMDMPEKEIDSRYYIGVLYVDALGLELPVRSELTYTGLRSSPCRYKGSVYTNNLIIAAHNYNSHFGRLKNLPIGSGVRFVDVDGNEFYYTADSIEVINGTDVDAMDEGDWDMTLFTCTYGGVERVTVRCSEYILEY